MAPCTVNKDVQLTPKERTRIKSGLQRFGLHLRNMRLIGGDTVITAALLPLLGFFLLHGLKDVPWVTIAGLLLVGLLLTATIFGLNNVTDAKIDACDPLKQTNGINPIALGQLTQREAMIPLLGCSLLALALAAWLAVLPWAFFGLVRRRPLFAAAGPAERTCRPGPAGPQPGTAFYLVNGDGSRPCKPPAACGRGSVLGMPDLGQERYHQSHPRLRVRPRT